QAKPFHAGLGAKNGLIAAKMAAAGMTADPSPFEGKYGFLELMAGPEAAGFTNAVLAAEMPLAMVSPGVWQKRYPCCASAHRAIDGVLQLMAEHALTPEDIGGIDIGVSEVAAKSLMYEQPQNEMQARFSLPYCVASAVYERDLILSTFSKAAFGRKYVSDFM